MLERRSALKFLSALVAAVALAAACGGTTTTASDGGGDAGAAVTRAPWERCRLNVDACGGGASCAHFSNYGGDSGAYCAPACGDLGRCSARTDGGFAMCVGGRCVESCLSHPCPAGFHCQPTGVPELRFCLPDAP